jgi:hypothetical protein
MLEDSCIGIDDMLLYVDPRVAEVRVDEEREARRSFKPYL